MHFRDRIAAIGREPTWGPCDCVLGFSPASLAMILGQSKRRISLGDESLTRRARRTMPIGQDASLGSLRIKFLGRDERFDPTDAVRIFPLGQGHRSTWLPHPLGEMK